MAADPVDPEVLAGRARNAPLTRPRPGHADLAGMPKYGFDDARPVLERASARETAARVALGTVAQAFLRQALGVEVLSHVVSLGAADAPGRRAARARGPGRGGRQPGARLLRRGRRAAMVAEVDAAQKDGDTLGGVVEVVAYGLPAGPRLATCMRPPARRPAGRRADGHPGHEGRRGRRRVRHRAPARQRGPRRDRPPARPRSRRRTNRAGGIEGGMTNGEPLRVRVAMKPISTVPKRARHGGRGHRRGGRRDPPALRRLRRARRRGRGRGDGRAGAGRRRAGEVRRRLAGRDRPQRCRHTSTLEERW